VRQLPATWAELVKAVKTDSHSPNQERLALLHAARNLFAKGPFASLDVSERKLLAGMEDEAGWFGRMTGHGDFHSLVNDSPGGLGAAIDVIPLMGPVTRVDYDRYVVLFRAAFKQASHGAGIASGSRLLALKRPDVFLPYNGANAHGVSQAFGIARTTTTLDNYWDRIVAPLQLLPWMTMPRPNKRVEGAIWDGRAALLDTLYYTPT
jgi:hypothetical protein